MKLNETNEKAKRRSRNQIQITATACQKILAQVASGKEAILPNPTALKSQERLCSGWRSMKPRRRHGRQCFPSGFPTLTEKVQAIIAWDARQRSFDERTRFRAD
jgi:hypothetical protein